MSQEYRIKTLADFLALSPEQRERCAVDLVAWASFIDKITASAPGMFSKPFEMVWVDDDRTGEVSGVVLLDAATGEQLHRVDFPAATGEASA